MTAFTSTALVLSVRDAETNVRATLLAAYAATAEDRERGTASDISKAWKRAGITPNNAAIVGDYAEAAVLCGIPADVLWRAIDRAEDGRFRKPHAYVTQARENHGGVKAARAFLARILAAVADAPDGTPLDDVVAGVAKILREMTAKPRAARPNQGESDTTPETDNVDETDESDETPETVKRDATADLVSVTRDLGAVVARWSRDGLAPSADAVAAFHAMAAQLRALDVKRIEASRNVS